MKFDSLRLLALLLMAWVIGQSVGCGNSGNADNDDGNGDQSIGVMEPAPSQEWEQRQRDQLEGLDWQSEKLSRLAEAQLGELAKMLASGQGWNDQRLNKLFVEATQFSGWRDGELIDVISFGGLRVRVDSGDAAQLDQVWTSDASPLTVGEALQELLSPLDGYQNRRAVFDVDKTLLLEDRRFITEVNVCIAGHVEATATGAAGQVSLPGSRSLEMKWLLRWELDADEQSARINAFRVTRMDDMRYRGQNPFMFSDSTSAVIDSGALLSMQFGLGVDQWARRLGASRLSGWSGIAVGDINGDDLEDFYVCQGQGLPNRLFAQRPDGTAEDVSLKSGVAFQEDTKVALFADLDNDGDQDLVLGMNAGVVLLENDGTGRFHYSSMLFESLETSCLAVADYNNDGYLDLLTSSYFREQRVDPDFADFNDLGDADNGGGARLYLNEGNMKMTSASQALGLNRRRFCRRSNSTISTRMATWILL